MPIVLYLLGVVTTAAGLVLIGSGLIPRDGALQTEVLTPGTIATVGGLLFIAFGVAIREMRRMERSFAARTTLHTARADEAVAAAFGAAGPTSSLPELKQEPSPVPAALAAGTQAEQVMIERLRAKIPTIPRVENGRLAETPDVSQALRETAGLEDSVAEVKGVSAVARAGNGAASPVRSVPRMDIKPRLARPRTRARRRYSTPSGRPRRAAATRTRPQGSRQSRLRRCRRTPGWAPIPFRRRRRGGVGPEIRRCRGDGLHALFRRLD